MTELLGAVLSGVLYGCSFPNFNFHILAWFAFVPFLTVSTRFRTGFLFGFVANLIIFFWIWKTFLAANIGGVTTFSVWIALASILAVYFGLFGVVYRKLPANMARPWLAALVWILFEKVRSLVITGFPWALLAHTQVANKPILQLASIGGELFVSFAVVLVNLTLAEIIAARNKKNIANAAIVGFLFGVVCIWGTLRVTSIKSGESLSSFVKVGLLQGNIDQYQKWDATYEAGIRERYESLVTDILPSKPDLVIWPESAVPGWYPVQKFYVDWVEGVVTKSNTFHLIGAVTKRDDKDFNAAFFLNPKAEIVGEYDKQKLVPFGEYIPFGGFLKRWIPYLGQLGTFDSGAGPVIFDLNGVKFSATICYEAMFGYLFQRKSTSDVDVFVNITNDGWFLDSAAPEQHYVANVFRAVETGRPVVRAANTGISAVIDPAGRELFRTALLVKGSNVVDVPIHRERTIFSMLYSKLCRAN